MDFAIVQIGSRQYLIKPGETLEVDKITDAEKSFTSSQVLLLSKNGQIEIGQPFLKETLNFEIIGNFRGPKIRVATYKAKSNFRKVIGQRRESTKIKLIEEGEKKGKVTKKVIKAVKKS